MDHLAIKLFVSNRLDGIGDESQSGRFNERSGPKALR